MPTAMISRRRLGELLDALEVPPCACPPLPLGYQCPHVRRARVVPLPELAEWLYGHALDHLRVPVHSPRALVGEVLGAWVLRTWAALWEAADPKGYATPLVGDCPALCEQRQDRGEVMQWRRRHRLRLWHQGDFWRRDDDTPDDVARDARHLRNGADDPDEQLHEVPLIPLPPRGEGYLERRFREVSGHAEVYHLEMEQAGKTTRNQAARLARVARAALRRRKQKGRGERAA